MRIFLDTDPVIIIQLAAEGPASARRAGAAKVVTALQGAGLGLRQEPGGTGGNMEACLAGGHTAEVFDIAAVRGTTQDGEA